MSFPKHIAIIPDGNRRWAKAQRLNPWEGHEQGVKTFWAASQELFNMGLENLTFWAASYDNLNKRSRLEVKFLINLLRTEIQNDNILNLAKKNHVKIKVVGEWVESIKDKKLIESIERLENETKNFSKGVLTLLFAYDGQREMLAATSALAKSGKTITASSLRKELWTGDLPDVDLVIRTGGEPHWSAGFMMWLTANSEMYFTKTLWPDFNNGEIKKALTRYKIRERRLGK
ncbi:MAG TPA: polyprenyl diphosphate synthase [Patescibacteria group bacterium]|nr:polyprenyl diphosphate synthase [Patescibacteria group bacterium]